MMMKHFFCFFYFVADVMFDYQPVSRYQKKLKYCRINGIPFEKPTKEEMQSPLALEWQK